MSSFDYTIVVFYLFFIGFAAWIFRRFSTSAGDFIQGGGAMMWWMAGATAFMTQFSAWTFTGAAAKAYEDGLSVMFIFWGNSLGFFAAAAFFARRYRRLRVETAMEVIRLRFGRSSEQLYTLLSFPVTLIACAIWMNGLASFFAATFDIDVSLTIIVIGCVVTFIAVSGGSWTVSVTNVIQLVLLLSVTIVIGFAALGKFPSPEKVFASFEPIYGSGISYVNIFYAWAIAILLQQTLSINHTLSSFRFLNTTNDEDATKAALVAGCLFVFAPLLWFMPAWYVASEGVDLFAAYPALQESANNAVYLYYIEHYAPDGLLGLVMITLVAATMAPLSSAHNRNAGIYVRNIYQVWIKPDANNRQQLVAGKLATLVSGLLAIISALLLASVKNYSLFEMMIMFAAFVQMPLNIPSLLSMITLRTPNWSGWATVLVGLMVSLCMFFLFDPQDFVSRALSLREAKELTVVATLIAHAFFTGGFFLLTRMCYGYEDKEITRSRRQLQERLKTPISAREQADVNVKQGFYVGSITSLAGGLLIVASLMFDGETRLTFMAIGALVLLFSGYLLHTSRNNPIPIKS